jgi:hypothetical protein
MLEEYEETFGEPSLWDGEPLLGVVTEMHRKEGATVFQAKQVATDREAEQGEAAVHQLVEEAEVQALKHMQKPEHLRVPCGQHHPPGGVLQLYAQPSRTPDVSINRVNYGSLGTSVGKKEKCG